MEPNVAQNIEHSGQQNSDRIQRNLLQYQVNGSNNQDVIFPFLNEQMISGIQGMPNSHLLLPRVQTSNISNDMQQTPHFI